MLKGIIDHFESKGLKIISAAYERFEKCEMIGNHEPDVTAKNQMKTNITLEKQRRVKI